MAIYYRWPATQNTVADAEFNALNSGTIDIRTAGTAAAITAATWTGGVATFTRTTHGLVVGTKITIAGVTPSGYNGTYIIATVPTADTFTVALVSDPSGSGTVFGTVQVIVPGPNGTLVGTLLGTVTYGATAYAAASGGAKASNAIGADTSADADGDASYAVHKKSDASTHSVTDVTATGGGGGLTMDVDGSPDTTVATGQTITVTGLTAAAAAM